MPRKKVDTRIGDSLPIPSLLHNPDRNTGESPQAVVFREAKGGMVKPYCPIRGICLGGIFSEAEAQAIAQALASIPAPISIQAFGAAAAAAVRGGRK